MILRVTCKCGAQLKLVPEHADKVIKCPTCTKKFRVPAEKFTAAAEKRSSAPIVKRGEKDPAARTAAIKQAIVSQASKEAVPANLDDELLGGSSGDYGLSDRDLMGALVHQSHAPAERVAPPPAAVPIADEAPIEMGYAQDPLRSRTSRSKIADEVSGPTRTFWVDLLHAFIFPFATLGNAMSTIFLAGLNVAGSFSGFGIFVSLYMGAVCMNIVGDSAKGDDDYKAVTVEGGFWDSIFRPFFRFAGTFALAMLPCIAYGFMTSSGTIEFNLFAFALCTAFGVFMWPMLMLLAATDSLGLISKPHLIIESVFRTILPYLAIWFGLLVATFLVLITGIGSAIMEQIGFGSKDPWTALLGGIGGRIIGESVSLYFTVVSMRLVGLYYLHCKRKFKFELE